MSLFITICPTCGTILFYVLDPGETCPDCGLSGVEDVSEFKFRKDDSDATDDNDTEIYRISSS